MRNQQIQTTREMKESGIEWIGQIPNNYTIHG